MSGLPDRRRLTELEGVIERGRQTFVEVGEALAEIRDQRLYRDTHGTFEDYCRERWSMDRVNAHRHIEAAQVVGMLSTDNRPSTVRQTRELARAEDPAATWQRVQAQRGDIVLFNWPGGDARVDHMARLVSIDRAAGTLVTVDGNIGNRVGVHERPIGLVRAFVRDT